MGKLTTRQKAERVLSMLLGLRSREVASALKGHGFTNADIAEGWSLLQRISRTSLDDVAANAGEEAEALDPIEAVRAWETKWLLISKATLARRAPNVHAWLFASAGEARRDAKHGKPVLAVMLFVTRWELLDKPKSKGGLGAEGRDAKALLATRGLDAEVIREAQSLLAAAMTLADDASAAIKAEGKERAGFDEAEEALWGWYLEWSRIARTVIKDRRLLRVMGFLESAGGKERGEAKGAKGGEGEKKRDDET